MKKLFIPILLFILISQNFAEKDLRNMTIQELMEVKIITASKKSEKLTQAPASVKVITAEEIDSRGYIDLIEIMSDLPGIDMAVTRGDLYYKAYWRGFRKGISSPFLLMVDGMILNHLYYNWTDIASALPLSSIERIEILYGPASTMYGPNAFMGVFNIITKKEHVSNGTNLRMRISQGNNNIQKVDFAYTLKRDNFNINMSGLFYQRNLDQESLENYEYTKPRYLEDKSLWGDFVDHKSIGNLENPHRNRSFSLNLNYDGTELGFNYYRVYTGWGTNYAFDRIPPDVIWEEPDYFFYFKDERNLKEKLSVKTFARYRFSAVSNESNSLEADSDYGDKRLISFGYWQSLNRSWEFYQDFNYSFSQNTNLKFGLKLEQKNLQKAYDLSYSDLMDPDSIDLESFQFPDQPVHSFQSPNRITWINKGLYGQMRYNFGDFFTNGKAHFINFGLRYDHNNEYGENITIRGGYVGKIDKVNLKLLYGESYREPSPRQLYGTWAAYESTANLKPEESRNIEAVINPIGNNASITINPYYVIIDNSINSINSTPQNIGKRQIMGVDIGGKYFYDFSTNTRIDTWGYYSFLKTKEDKFDINGKKIGSGIVGDLSNHKVYLGATLSLWDQWSLTLKSKYIGKRKTVSSNPVDYVDGVNLTDLNLMWRKVYDFPLNLSVKINNLFDTDYFHPGVRAANAGMTPGYWQNNHWYGSRGWNNSLIPQPGREIIVSIDYNVSSK